MMLLGLNQLGDASSDAVSAFESVASPYIGALTDQIKPQLQAAVQPYVIASLLLGLFGFGFGLAAFIGMKNLKRSRA